MDLKPLYSLSSTGKEKYWSIQVVDDHLHMTFGYTGGRMQTTTRKVQRKDPYKEALSRWEKKLKQGYFERNAGAGEMRTSWAMLAHDYTKRARDVIFPCFVQPKVDGVRVLFKEGTFYTRSGDERHFDAELAHGLSILKFPYPLDGELYNPTLSFEELAGLVNRDTLTLEESQKLNFYIFDYISEEPFKVRMHSLQQLRPCTERITILETQECLDTAQVDTYLEMYLARGFEGLILRNACGVYKSGFRSKDLQKYKLFQEEEFKITGYKQGKGKASSGVIWKCAAANGHEFYVKPACTDEMSAAYLSAADSFIGHPLTVKYQEKTKYGVPRFPVAKGIRYSL